MAATHARLAAIFFLCFVLAGCSSSAVHFTTELGAPGDLSKDDPVVHGGAQIGKVTGISPLSYGSSEVGFDVERQDASLVHQDSIMVLNAGADSLELRNPNPASPLAAPGARIAGASSEAEARGILAARGLGQYAMGLAQMLAALGSGSSSPANLPALAPLIQQLLAIQQRAALGTFASSPAGRQELRHLARQLEAVRRELVRQGSSIQAQRLKNEIDRLLGAITAPSAPHNTLVAPRVYP